MGLFKYITLLFANDNLQQVCYSHGCCDHRIMLNILQISCPTDYWLWQQAMYTNFGEITSWVYVVYSTINSGLRRSML